MKCPQTGAAVASLTSTCCSSCERCFFCWYILLVARSFTGWHSCHSHFTNLSNQLANILNFHYFTNGNNNVCVHTHTHTGKSLFPEGYQRRDKTNSGCQLALFNHSFSASDAVLRKYFHSIWLQMVWNSYKYTSLILFQVKFVKIIDYWPTTTCKTWPYQEYFFCFQQHLNISFTRHQLHTMIYLLHSHTYAHKCKTSNDPVRVGKHYSQVHSVRRTKINYKTSKYLKICHI